MENSTKSKSALLCSMCNNYLVNSYRLPCGHTFCFKCLKNSEKIKDNKITCHSCNTKFTIPLHGIIGFEFVSGSEILRERIYSRLNNDKKAHFYASDPNLDLSNPSSERPKSSGHSSKMQDDPTYKRYSKYNQTDTTPSSVRYIKRNRKSPSRHSSNLFTRRKNLDHKQEEAEITEPDQNSRSVLSDILTRRSLFKKPEKVVRERPKTSYEFPQQSKVYEAMTAEEQSKLEDSTGSCSPTIVRGNIKGRSSFKTNHPDINEDTENKHDHSYDNIKSDYIYSDSNFNNHNESSKPHFDSSSNRNSFKKDRLDNEQKSKDTHQKYDYSYPNIKNDFNKTKNNVDKSYESPKFNFDYSKKKSSFNKERFGDIKSSEKPENILKEEHKNVCNKGSFDESDGGGDNDEKKKAKGCFKSKIHARETYFGAGDNRPSSGKPRGLKPDNNNFKIYTNTKSLSSESINVKHSKRKGEVFADSDLITDAFEMKEPGKQSRNFLDRFNNPELFNRRILKMRISRLRYAKIMNDANLDEALLLSEEEKEDVEVDDIAEGGGGGGEVEVEVEIEDEQENAENIDPNQETIIKPKKTKSQLTEEELKVNGRSLIDVVNAARKKYSIYLEAAEENFENSVEGKIDEEDEGYDENRNTIQEKYENEIESNVNDINESEFKFENMDKQRNNQKEDFNIINMIENEESVEEVIVREKPVMEMSEGVIQRWKVEKNDFSIPSSILIVQDVVVVADYGLSCLEYYDSQGKFEHQIDGVKPFCLTNYSRKPEKIMVGDRKSKGVRVFDKYGSDIEQWEGMNVEWMSGIGMLSSGKMCVLDRARCKVSIISAGGTVAQEFGSFGNNKHQLCMADFLVVDNNDRIIISDSGNHCIKVFDSEGKFVLKFGEKGSEDGQLSWPKGVTVDSQNNIIIADSNNNRISCFSPEGVFIKNLISNIVSPYNLHFNSSQNLLGVTGYSLAGTSFRSVFHLS